MTRAYIVCGAPASGKTTYGRKLAENKQAVFLDIDAATGRLVRLALDLSGRNTEDRDSPYFKKHFREPIYEQLFDIARNNVSLNSVVIAGPFTRETQDPEWPEKLAASLGAPVEIHYVCCPAHIRKERMIKRAHSRDAGKLRDWEGYLQYYGKEPPPACKHFPVDNSADLKV